MVWEIRDCIRHYGRGSCQILIGDIFNFLLTMMEINKVLGPG